MSAVALAVTPAQAGNWFTRIPATPERTPPHLHIRHLDACDS